MRYDEARDRRAAVDRAEADGRVADSGDVRLALMRKVKSGEITLQAAQDALARIKRNAKKSGKVTRNQAWNGK